MRLIRGVISEVSAADFEEAKLFSASGLPGQTFKNREYFEHYGYASRPLPGAEGIIFVQGNTVYMVASDDRRYRISLEEGEVALYTDEGDKIHLKRNKEIHINSGNKVQIDAGAEVEINAPMATVNVTTSAKVVSPIVNLGGAAGHQALLNEAAKAIINSHSHPGVQSGGGNTGVPNQQLGSTEQTVNLKAT